MPRELVDKPAATQRQRPVRDATGGSASSPSLPSSPQPSAAPTEVIKGGLDVVVLWTAPPKLKLSANVSLAPVPAKLPTGAYRFRFGGLG
jgi:hypothetical protein